MGRRSLATERRREIIAATIACMSVHGVAGTTLERIADVAGMGRGHIRHYVGNRDELLTDSARVFYFGDEAADEKNLATAASKYPILDPSLDAEQALDYLFGEFSDPDSDTVAALAFMDAGRTMPAINEIVVKAYFGMRDSLIQIIRRSHPSLTPAQASAAAYGVLSLAMGNVMLSDIDLSYERMREARLAAELVIHGPVALQDTASFH